jgi:hypothetical protein
MNPVLTRAATGMVLALAVAGALNYYHSVDERNRAYQDPWATYMIGIGPERFRGVIAMVPPEAVVGYVSDLPDLFNLPDLLSSEKSRRGAVWSAQAWYALAPRLVIPHQNPKNQDWILGNFSKPVDLAQIERENRITLVRDFGAGVVVFRSR